MIRQNSVLVFPYEPEHIVKIGDYITCTCYEDWKCDYLKKTVQRIWDTNEEFITYYLKKTERMPSISCPICLEDFKYLNRGSGLSICDTCLRVFCMNCVNNLASPTCPLCNDGQVENFKVL
jgi:hypothetical protein